MNIAIAVDLSAESYFAVRWALDLRARAREQGLPTRCYAVCIASSKEPFEFQSLAYPDTTEDPGVHHRITHRVRTFLESVDDDVDDVEVVIKEGEAAQILSRFCDRHDIEWLVTGMSSAGPLARLLVGSTVHDLIDQVPANLAVIHPEYAQFDPPLNFTVGVDFLPGSDSALFAAAELAELTGAHLNLVHALQDAPTGTVHGGLVNYLANTDIAHLTAEARNSLESMMEELEKQFPDLSYSTLVHSGSPQKVLLDFIDSHDVDIVFLGKILHSTFERWTLGSVSRTLIRKMPTTIVLTPH